ncbi:MAG: serine/threonine protein kinase [Myxococcales bacterium]|nr:serine/threonine protein kinase [Myxococcales bacterium]MCB9582686.1 serine/threonine protein kinase [Polyangiaceae bacterium]
MAEAPRTIGRYALHTALASGGMATVHLGRLLGPVGFSRTVAIKRLHASFAQDPDFVSMFLDEARLAARIRHPNVVPVLDVVALEGELFLVMEYVQGEALSRLRRSFGKPIAVPVVARIAVDMLNGLHAAHEAKNERGEPLDIVHRDVSPHNILVGVDGISRVTDFGIAKAENRIQTTREGQIKGKLAYMAPEQLRERAVDRRTDVYAAAVVVWEALTAKKLFARDDPGAMVARILEGNVQRPSALVPGIPSEVDAIVMQGLAANPDARFASAQEMALALEHAVRLEPAARVGQWVEQVAASSLTERAAAVADLETASHSSVDSVRSFMREASQSLPAPEPERPSSTHSVAQVSSLSVDSPGETKTPNRRPLVLVAVVLGVLGIAAVVALSRTSGGRAPEPITAASSAKTAEPTPETTLQPLASAPPPPSASAPAPEQPAKVVHRPAATHKPPAPPPPEPTKNPSDFSNLTRE